MFGLFDPTKVAESQLSSYDPKTGRREKDLGDHIGDAAMSIIMPGFGGKVDQATQDLYVDTLKEGAGNRLTRYGSVVGGEDTSNLSRLSATQLDQRLSANEALKGARNQAVAATGRDRAEYMDLSDPDAILSLAATHVKADRKAEKAQEKAEAAAIRQEGYERQDSLYAHQTQQTNLMNAHNADQANKQRAHEFAVQEARNAQTMQLAMMDREAKMADRQYMREERAADKRQQSIMMLIKGLSQLGAGFSI